MNAAFIRTWAAAARSGEYRQCKGHFRDGDGNMCILGLGYHLMGGEFLPFDGWTCFTDGDAYSALEIKTGLSEQTLGALANANNAGKDFRALADDLEALLPRGMPESVRAIFECEPAEA